MSHRRLLCVLLLVAPLLPASVAPAAVLYRKGQKGALVGDIQKLSRTEIVIKPKTKEAETIPVNEVTRLRFDDEPAKLNLARTHEEKGALELALKSYEEVLAENPSDANLKADLEYLIARTQAKMALADPSMVDEAAKKLDAFRKAHPDSFRFYESLDFLAQLYLAQGNFENAKSTFTQMEQAPWNDYKMAARSGNGRVLLRQEQFPQALEAFDQVIAMPGTSPAEVSRRQDAMLGKVACLQQQKQYDEAVKVLDEIIEKVSPDDRRIQAEAYVRQGDCFEAAGKNKDALLAFLHVDLLFAGETAQHAEALYHLSRLWTAASDRPDRAADAAAELQRKYPKSEWAKKLTVPQE